MVKIKSENKKQKKNAKKRVRGKKTKSRKIKNKKTEKKDSNNLILLITTSEEKNDRTLALLILLKITKQIKVQFPLPDKYLFSIIALFDSYLNKVDKKLNRTDIIKALFGCIDIIDKESNFNFLSNSNFKKYIDVDLVYDILEIVDLDIYPEKMYDHFAKFYYQLEQSQKGNIFFLSFLNIFKKKYLKISFLLLINNKSINKKPIINFISCWLYTYENIRKDMPIEAAFLTNCIKKLFEANNYCCKDFLDSKNLIDESIYLCNYSFEDYF